MKSLIDYDGDSAKSESPSDLGFQGIKEYWRTKKHLASGQFYQWFIKDQALLSRLMKEYKADDICSMIDLCLKKTPERSFSHFFQERNYYYRETHPPTNYGFD